MKKTRISRILACVFSLALFVGAISVSGMKVSAANTVVTGTVSKGTTANLLCLYEPSNGTYKLVIDDSTDTSHCKFLTIGKTVTVSMYRGNDSNLHAAVIASGKSLPNVSVDSSKTSTVTGTVMDATTDDMLYLKTSDGDMQIKIDAATNTSACKVLVSGAKITVVVSRGSDAYMHAVSISSGTGATTTTTTSSTSSSSTDFSQTSGTPVSGTATSESKDGVLYLSTKDGTYYIVCDGQTDTSGGFMFVPGNKLTAYIYRGNDANMHASRVTGTRSGGSTLGSSKAAFGGTVDDKSNEEILYLKTSGGIMAFKLDPSTSLTGAKNLIRGRNVVITGAVGSDQYWHAISIEAK